MIKDSTRERLEEEYEMPVERLMFKLYREEGMSQYEIAEEVNAHREAVRHWLQRSGVKMRSRTLTDVQRLLILAYLSSGYGISATSEKAQCGQATVQRYRKDVETTGEPVGFEKELSTRDWDILCEIIENDIVTEPASSESTSNCRVDSD